MIAQMDSFELQEGEIKMTTFVDEDTLRGLVQSCSSINEYTKSSRHEMREVCNHCHWAIIVANAVLCCWRDGSNCCCGLDVQITMKVPQSVGGQDGDDTEVVEVRVRVLLKYTMFNELGHRITDAWVKRHLRVFCINSSGWNAV